MNKINIVIVGMGVAGQVRLRDAALFPELNISGIVSRRPQHATIDVAAALADPAIDGVIICSENATHYDLAYQALNSGKHVLLEFPVARTLAQTQTLLELARQKQLILQVEHISLLSKLHAWHRNQLQQHRLSRVEFNVSGDYKNWLKADAQLGLVGNLSVGRLMTLRDLLGPLKLANINFQNYSDGFSLQCDLLSQTFSAIKISLSHVRREGLKRSHHLAMYHGDSMLQTPDGLNQASGLFAQDLNLFLQAINQYRQSLPYASYVSAEMLLNVMELAGDIDLFAKRHLRLK